jgi:hypothetical protein
MMDPIDELIEIFGMVLVATIVICFVGALVIAAFYL